MKNLIMLNLACFLLISGGITAQPLNESTVFSSGGGASTGGIYSNFAVVGEVFVASPVSAASTSTNIGFIFRTNEMLATLVNLKVILEGLYSGSGLMNKARNESGDQYDGSVADKITLELHNAVNYATTTYTNNNIDLNTDGTATVSVPSAINGSFYVTVKHRNSIATVSNSPLIFSGGQIEYDFSSGIVQAFGNNLKDLGEGLFGMYAGDTNGDGIISALDLIEIGNQAANFSSGYINTDVNGDGVIDALDLIITDNNSSGFVSVKTP
jgi:hypothetical protein